MSADLIARLAADLRPVPRHALSRRLASVTAAALAASALLMLFWLGVRSDIAAAIATPIFWAKFCYPLALGVLGFFAVQHLGRPGARRGAALPLSALVVATIVAGALIDYGLAPADQRQAILFGGSAWLCPFLVLALSALPAFGGLVVLRSLAPTRLTLAGFAAGLMAGAFGAWIYSFHCTENGLPFLATWYTLGMLMPALIGTLAGRFVLRW